MLLAFLFRTDLVPRGGGAVPPGEREGEGGEDDVVVDVERAGVLLVDVHLFGLCCVCFVLGHGMGSV